jgi:hypothetical protein
VDNELRLAWMARTIRLPRLQTGNRLFRHASRFTTGRDAMSHETEAAMLEVVDELTDFFDGTQWCQQPRLLARLLQRLALECAAHELDKRATVQPTGVLHDS